MQPYTNNGYLIQIGPEPGSNYGSIVNINCKDVEYPANGECTDRWQYYNGTDWDYDQTVTIDCTGMFYRKTSHAQIKLLKITYKLNYTTILMY